MINYAALLQKEVEINILNFFNSSIIARYILDKTYGLKRRYYWENKLK